MKFSVHTFREANLEARWTRDRKGAPIIVARVPNGRWYMITKGMWERMQESGDVRGTFEDSTLLGDIFSVAA